GTLDGALEVRDALDGVAVDLGDDHSRPHELLVERAGRGDTGDDDALDVVRNGVALPHAAGQVLVLDAQPVDAALALGLALLRLLVRAGAFPQLHGLGDGLAVAQDFQAHRGVGPLGRDVAD